MLHLGQYLYSYQNCTLPFKLPGKFIVNNQIHTNIIQETQMPSVRLSARLVSDSFLFSSKWELKSHNSRNADNVHSSGPQIPLGKSITQFCLTTTDTIWDLRCMSVLLLMFVLSLYLTFSMSSECVTPLQSNLYKDHLSLWGGLYRLHSFL